MFAKRGVKAFSQMRRMATEAGAGDAPVSNGKMESLLEKLASITSNGPAGAAEETMLGKAKGKNSRGNRKPNNANNQRSAKGNRKDASSRNNNRNNRPSRNNSSERNNQRRGTGRRPHTVQTVSHFDRFKNPKKSSTASQREDGLLNAAGLSFADMQEARALFIRRKVSDGGAATLHTGDAAVFNFFHSRAVHRANNYGPRADQFARFEETPNVYRAAEVSKPDLELSKDKMGYDTKSRVLRALEQITTRRGFKLSDVERKNDSFLPATALLYPYANTTLPNNLERPRANLKHLASVPEEEISATLAAVVRGQRPELVYNPKEDFKTEQLKINAQVVVNSLNRNAQLQVDNLHKSMAKVMLGQQPIKTLPQPLFPPKKL
ncbi:hypothetical protein PICMEDRAFT_15391 [Pichia membranifaciens NRRL Y-2026]|uniref:Uncharacterized protein n=1 Tax=Pichia membranifaciens NRRL Y-2026 TaxID=763406 RepID=A0A1E3NMU0_9ASCO|nr:hypothetical protein PICMEDRAFT_15391 [Pichia membranifaciens NRRL Y-2026]ODQ47444.1 hypothetical protein PICMEDRAFT_15391 [Pichia membranifaciens NRRL Y-2026]